MLCGQGAVDVRSCALSVWLPCDCTWFTLQCSPLTTRWQQITTSDSSSPDISFLSQSASQETFQTVKDCNSVFSFSFQWENTSFSLTAIFIIINCVIWHILCSSSELLVTKDSWPTVTIRANVRTMQLLRVSHSVYIHISLSRVVFFAQYTENCGFWTQRIIYLMLEQFYSCFY